MPKKLWNFDKAIAPFKSYCGDSLIWCFVYWHFGTFCEFSCNGVYYCRGFCVIMGGSYSAFEQWKEECHRILEKRHLLKILKTWAIISDGRSIFYNKFFKWLLEKYAIFHNVETHYHQKPSGNVEGSHREFMRISSKTVNASRTDWWSSLHDALSAYHTTSKTPIGMSLYQFVCGKAFHLLV